MISKPLRNAYTTESLQNVEDEHVTADIFDKTRVKEGPRQAYRVYSDRSVYGHLEEQLLKFRDGRPIKRKSDFVTD